MLRSFPVLILLSLSVGTAAAQQTRVVPWSLVKTDGNTGSAYPFGYTTGRTQQVIDGAALCSQTSILMGLAVRRDARGTNTYKARVVPSLKLSLGHTRITPSTMSTTFASNRTGTMTVVFPAASFNLPPLPPSNPGTFSVKWSWKTPFVYSRSKGNLLVEWEIPGSPGKSEYFMDAHGSRSLGGRALNYGIGGVFAGKDPYSVVCPSPSTLVPGGSLSLGASGLKKAYPAVAVVGTSRTVFGSLSLPFDLGPLGAPGNSLYARPTFLFSIPLSQSGGSYGGSLSLPLPSDPWFAGAKFYGQFFFADKASNSLGLVFSNGVEMNLGLSSPPMQLLGSYDANRPTGYMNKTLPTGVVIQFTGVFG